jgi:uncharacterized protein YndB with AHSA1/START domain
MRIDFTVQIDRSAEDVFAYLVDVDRLTEWQGSAVECRSDGPLREGSLISERRRLLGREAETELEVTAFEPPRRLTLRSLSGPVNFTVDHELVENGDGTTIHFAAEAQQGAFLSLAKKVIAKKAEQEFRGDFARLKAILEAG